MESLKYSLNFCVGLVGTDESITVSDVDEAQRSLTTVIRTVKHQIVLHVSIPPSYPDGVIPIFQFGKGTTLDANGKLKMTKVFHSCTTLPILKDGCYL